MGMIEEGLRLGEINGVNIPRRKRSSSVESKPDDDGASISMMEVATIMIAMANANGGYYKRKRKKSSTSKQRKKSSTPKQRKKSPTKKQRRKSRGKEMELGKSPPEMPAAMRDRIVGNGGIEIELVIQKKLEESDVNRNNGRLSLPAKKVRREFVREEEKKILDEEKGKNEKKKKGMEVGIVDDFLRESSMWLKKWKIGSGKDYCLMNNWNCFVEENGLRSGDFVQLWSFRINSSDRLCFAIVKLSHLL
ncbi:B3 domain-containing protein At1g05920-like [Benincasa hispida]|uniref:B3 domain-containing protein At1g05920-like n=1 Tax=Benincasa hispida TaxID=102211 RepID=UPI0018FF935D|nr:B3 domain-containing protein At1g05920-like [Benincasa hispida]